MSTTQQPDFPVSGHYIQAIRESCHSLRTAADITIERSNIERLLLSPAFTSSFQRVSKAHGLAFPLNFPSIVSELNLLSVLSLLNFASGYRVPLHEQTGRGAWDNIRALTFSLYITSSSETDWLSARGMKAIREQTIAEQMNISVHVERPHETLPGVTVGELGGPLHKLVQLIMKTLNETGDVLLKAGYPDLGTFVLEGLKKGEKPGNDGSTDVEVVLEHIVRAIPGFRDMTAVHGQSVYVFKKALFLLHAISIRFGSSGQEAPRLPVPDTSSLPVFTDNVLPSMLVHLGVLNLSSTSSSLSAAFPDHSAELDLLLGKAEEADISAVVARLPKKPPTDGPALSVEDAYTMRAAAIDACEMIVDVAHSMDLSSVSTAGSDVSELQWLRSMTLPDLDMWLWAVAKDRKDYRRLERFVLRDTVMF